jgi:hypothetical protein
MLHTQLKCPHSCQFLRRRLPVLLKRRTPSRQQVVIPSPFSFTSVLEAILFLLDKPLFQACIDFSYHPNAFCYYDTVSLRKPGKGDYSVPGAWQPIDHLNTLRKVLRSVIARQILSLSEEHSLLPAQHIEACPGRSIDTALDFLVQQIHSP